MAMRPATGRICSTWNTLFTQAKAPEQGIEQVVHTGAARQSIERCPSYPKVLRDQDNIARRFNGLKRLASVLQGFRLAAIERQCILGRKQRPGRLNHPLQQGGEALTRQRRNGQRPWRRDASAWQIRSRVDWHQAP